MSSKWWRTFVSFHFDESKSVFLFFLFGKKRKHRIFSQPTSTARPLSRQPCNSIRRKLLINFDEQRTWNTYRMHPVGVVPSIGTATWCFNLEPRYTARRLLPHQVSPRKLLHVSLTWVAGWYSLLARHSSKKRKKLGKRKKRNEGRRQRGEKKRQMSTEGVE